MNGLAASRPSATMLSVGAWAPPSTSSMTLSVASASTFMIATVITSLAAGTTMSNTRLRALNGREGNPLAVDQREPHAADGTGERQPGDLGRRRRGVDREHVVQVVGVQAQDRDHDLDSRCAGPRRTSGAQWPVDEPAGQDRVGWRAGPRAGRTIRGYDRRHTSAPRRRRQGEEVEVFLGVLAGGGRRQQHVFVVEVRDYSTCGLLASRPVSKRMVRCRSSRCRWWRLFRTRLLQFQIQT